MSDMQGAIQPSAGAEPASGNEQQAQQPANEGQAAPQSASPAEEGHVSSAPKVDKRVPWERFDAVQKAHAQQKAEFAQHKQEAARRDAEFQTLKGELETLKKQATPQQRSEIDEQLEALAGSDPTTAELLKARKELSALKSEMETIRSGYQSAEVRYHRDVLFRQVDAALADCKYTNKAELLASLRNLSADELADDDIVFKVAESLESHYSSKFSDYAEKAKDDLLAKWGINPANATPAQEAAAEAAVKGKTPASSLSSRHPPRPQQKATGPAKVGEFDLNTPAGRKAKWAAMIAGSK